jgi:hypothetical protein
MNRYQKSQRILAAVLILAILVGLVFGILGDSGKSAGAKPPLLKAITWAAFVFVMLPLVLYWILPRTAWGKRRLVLGVSAYLLSFYAGISVGILGLAAVLIDPVLVVTSHLFELLLALFGLDFAFWAMVMKARRTTDPSKILDERQVRNLADSAAVTLLLVTCFMTLMYFASYQGAFAINGMVWFLVYFFSSMVVFSASALHRFRRG